LFWKLEKFFGFYKKVLKLDAKWWQQEKNIRDRQVPFEDIFFEVNAILRRF